MKVPQWLLLPVRQQLLGLFLEKELPRKGTLMVPEEEGWISVDIVRACAESRALPARQQSSDIQHYS